MSDLLEKSDLGRAMSFNPFAPLLSALARVGIPPLPELASVQMPVYLGEFAVQVAIEELGNGEEGKNNAGPHVERYRRERGPRGAWCAAFTSYCFEEAWARIHSLSGWHMVPLSLRRKVPAQRSHGAKRFFKNVAKAGARVESPSRGDLVLWDRGRNGDWRGHVGIVDVVDRDTFLSIEGNVGLYPAVVRRRMHHIKEPRLIGFARI